MLHIIKIFSISFIIIFLLHQCWNYIKNTYSTKKTKDVLSFQTQKYKSIIQELLSNTQSSLTEEEKNKNQDLILYEQNQNQNQSEFLPIQEVSSMEDELHLYLQEQEQI